jgi:signal transduction histidine kinase
MSTRARLTSIFSVLFGTIVVCLAIASYLLYRQDAYSKLDSSLRAAVDATALSAEHEIAEHKFKAAAEGDFRDILFHAQKAILPDTQILIREGERDVAFRPTANPTIHLDSIPSSELISGRTVANARIQARQLEVPKFHAVYDIYAARSVIATRQELAALRRDLLLLVSFGLIAASLGSYVLARKALAPLTSLATTIESVTSSDLAARVPVPESSDDISRLAARFNSLLDRLQHAFTMQRRFMADASHELRTPLTVALAAVQVTQHDPRRTREDSDAALRLVEDQLMRLKKLVDNLFLLAQADSSGLKPAATEFYLDDVVSEAARAARSLAQARDQSLNVDPLPEARCTGDPDLVKQCLLILLDNAVKFTPDKGQIRIGIQRDGPLWSCQVADSGIGIPPEAQGRIFERFFRADNTEPVAVGAGLGLAIAKSIAESHGGCLTLVESRPGSTIFKLSIPALDEHAAAADDHANSLAVKM